MPVSVVRTDRRFRFQLTVETDAALSTDERDMVEGLGQMWLESMSAAACQLYADGGCATPVLTVDEGVLE